MQKFNLKINKKLIRLRLANITDLRFVFNLYNENIKDKKTFSRKKVLFTEHKKWFLNKIKLKMFFICIYKKKVGYIRYDNLSKRKLSISIAIKKDYKRKGFGRIMFEKSFKKKKIKKFKIVAMVKQNNLPSIKFFKKLGFLKIQKNLFLMKTDS